MKAGCSRCCNEGWMRAFGLVGAALEQRIGERSQTRSQTFTKVLEHKDTRTPLSRRGAWTSTLDRWLDRPRTRAPLRVSFDDKI